MLPVLEISFAGQTFWKVREVLFFFKKKKNSSSSQKIISINSLFSIARGTAQPPSNNLAPVPLSDNGAWHGYALPDASDLSLIGGFTGPWIHGVNGGSVICLLFFVFFITTNAPHLVAWYFFFFLKVGLGDPLISSRFQILQVETSIK